VKCPQCECSIEVEPEMVGRRVTCPECDEGFLVPRRSPRDDEDDEPPRPRRKKRRKSAAGPNWGLIGGLAVGALVLAAGGVVAYRATRPKPEAVAADSGGKVPSGDPQPAPGKPDDRTTGPIIPGAGVPKSAPEPTLPPEPPLPNGWVRFTAKEVALAGHLPGPLSGPAESTSDMSIRVENRKYDYELPGQAGGYDLDVMILPVGATPTREQESVFLRLPRHQIERLAKGQVTAERSTTLAGAPATEFEFTVAGNITGVYRYGFVRAGGRLLFVMAKAGGPKVSPADRQAFLDSIRPAGR
jgi:hypothetical protein